MLRWTPALILIRPLAMLRHWSSWTCPLHSTLSATPSCVGACSHHSVCLVQRYDGSSGICILGRSSLYVRRGQMRSAFMHLFLWSTARIGTWAYSIYYLHGRSGFCPHLCADDTQVYGSCRPSAVHDFPQRLSACLDGVAIWMRTNRLQLEHQQDGLALVFHCPPSTPAANHSSQSRARSRQPFTLGAGP